MIMISMEDILDSNNISIAMKYIQSKKDVAGPDGIKPSGLEEYWNENRNRIEELIYTSKYEPGAVQQFENLSAKGKKRSVSIMNAVDKMLARAINQRISNDVDRCMSERCYGYRNGLGTKDIVEFARTQIENGNTWVAELDIKDFFNNIPHSGLFKNIDDLFEDIVLKNILQAFITCRMEVEEGVFRLAKGVLQGMPISPLLSNIFLMHFDAKMEERYEGYCRYGDDIRVYVSSQKEALQVLEHVKKEIVNLGLNVNDQKSGAYIAINRPHFGYELVAKGNRILMQQIKHTNKEIYHVWQQSSVKEIDHNYHIVNDGILTRKDFTLLFENEEGKKYLPIETIESLSIYSNVIFSGGFFELANSERIAVNFINKTGDNVGRFIPQTWKKDIKVEMAQINLLSNDKEHLRLAKIYQTANIFNIRASLRYYERRGSDEIIKSTVDDITQILDKVKKATAIDQLMMFEAQARQKYFQCFNTIMSGDDFEFVKRSRRPPKDAINAMISFGNTLLYTRFANEIYRSALDIRFGILHNSTQRTESLNLDLADLFKPILVDRTIFTLVNRKMINEIQDFEETENGGIYMTYRGKRIFIREFEQKLSQLVSYKSGKKSYAELIRLEVTKLQQYFRNGNEYKPYKYVN